MHRIAFALLLAACSSDPGDPCTGAIGDCHDAHSGLWCIGGVMTSVRCDGPRGCSQEMLQVFCDQSVSSAGEACVGPEGGAACSSDRTAFLRCAGGRMTLAARCRGPSACHREGSTVYCDESIAVAGEPCVSEGAACSADGRQVLDCVNGSFAVRHPADTCRAEGGTLYWTGAYAIVGEACSGESRVCSADDRLLECRGGHLAVFTACRGENGCGADGEQFRCDQSIAAVGDACTGEGMACSQDHSAALRCQNGAFVHETDCTGQCSVRDGMVYCTRAR